MKITVKQSDLNHALGTVRHAVNNSSTLPILANILLTIDQGRLKLSATNLEIGINCWIDAEVQEEGSTTVPAKTISDLVGSLRPGQVEIEAVTQIPLEKGGVTSHVLNIKGQGSNATIKGMDPSEFPLIPSAEGNEEPIHLDAKQLGTMIDYVAFAAADDDARPVLTGVCVEMDGANEKVTFAAADAFRLAVMSEKVALPATLVESNLLIPARTLEQLARILPNEGTVQMIVTPNRSQVLFHTDNVDLVSRLIEGTFPNFRGIMPKEWTTRAVIEVKELAAAVKTVMPFARDSSNIARVKFDQSDEGTEYTGSLTIEATAEDIGSNVSTINAVVEGPSQEIIFNAKYLSDVLSALDCAEVAIEIQTASKPGVLKPVNGAEYAYLIMPMSTNR